MCVEFCWHADSFKTLSFIGENHESNIIVCMNWLDDLGFNCKLTSNLKKN
jgi:hypothetical protein